MATESIISATFGTPGSGKTYSRVKFLVDDFLINNPSGMYITNIPLDIPAISDYISRMLSKGDRVVTSEDVSSRLHIIPDHILISWEKLNQLENRDLNTFTSDTFPPSSYFQQFNLEGAHIAIDEFHKYFSKKGPKPLRKLWNDWFAEIRKTGCVFEAITQSYGQMSEEFLDKCATRLELVNHADLRDPFFQIKLGDWYELKAGLFGKLPLQRVSERETMRGTSDSGRVVWKPTGKNKTFVLDPLYFSFYNSFRNYTGSSAQRKSPSEIYGKKILIWFIRRHFISLFSRFFVAALLVYFLLGGGVQFCIMSLFKTLSFAGEKNSTASLAYSGQVDPGKVDPGKVAPGKVNSGQVVSMDELKLQDEIRKRELAEKDLYRPALFFNEYCFLRNSLEIFVGYKFTEGVFNGQTVKKIDSKKRVYILDNGLVVPMF